MKDDGRGPKASDGPGKVGRRDFLRMMGSGAGIAAGAAAGAGTLATAPAHADSESSDDKRKARYRETEHVKTYYRVNRYPAKG